MYTYIMGEHTMNNYMLRLSTTISKEALFDFYFDSVYQTIWQLRQEYPGFRNWYYNIVRPGMLIGKREIILSIVNDYIAGVLVLKNNHDERKICTLRVCSNFQRNGIGKSLISKSFEFLDTEKPLITVNAAKENQFNKIFNHFGFEKTFELSGHYRQHEKEIVYNELL